MSNPEPVRVVLELEHNEQTVSGRIAVDDIPRGAFYGWLELIDQLQRAAGGPPTNPREEADHGR